MNQQNNKLKSQEIIENVLFQQKDLRNCCMTFIRSALHSNNMCTFTLCEKIIPDVSLHCHRAYNVDCRSVAECRMRNRRYSYDFLESEITILFTQYFHRFPYGPADLFGTVFSCFVVVSTAQAFVLGFGFLSLWNRFPFTYFWPSS